jgi:hypothetical protein
MCASSGAGIADSSKQDIADVVDYDRKSIKMTKM